MFQLPQTSRVMEEFHDLCAEFQLEAKIESLPNPSDMTVLRVITFQSFSEDTIKVIREDGQYVIIPARGTVQVMLQQYELPPRFERIE